MLRMFMRWSITSTKIHNGGGMQENYDLYIMKLNYLFADIVFPVSTGPVNQGIVVVDDTGKIKSVVDPVSEPENHGSILRRDDVKKMSGALVPGFINSHCHLELSHLKGKIGRCTGLPAFLKAVTSLRNVEKEVILEAMLDAEQEMINGGIVAVGDISNTLDSIEVKKQHRLKYHTFIEVFDLNPIHAHDRFNQALILEKKFDAAGLSASIVPHATYTVSGKLLGMIAAYATEKNALFSIHNQETPGEDLFFLEGKGELFDFLSATGKYTDWMPTGTTALKSIMGQLPVRNPSLLVHNTFSSKVDIVAMLERLTSVWWCLCPNANDYIESKQPPVAELMQAGAEIVLGTDSLSSNERLSILDEMATIKRNHPELSFNRLLHWATLSPARYFGWQDQLGSFELGKTPGVIQLEDGSGGDFQDAGEIRFKCRHY